MLGGHPRQVSELIAHHGRTAEDTSYSRLVNDSQPLDVAAFEELLALHTDLDAAFDLVGVH